MAGPDDNNNWWQQDQQAPTGDAFLNTLPPDRASMVKALAEGREALPSGYSMRSPFGQQLLSDVAQYDPTFDAANLPARVATRKAFTSGKQGQNIVSFNTALGHLLSMAQSSEDLSNGRFPAVNAVENWLGPELGNTDLGSRLAQYGVDKNAVIEELTRAFKGGNPDVHGAKGWEAILSPNAPLPTQRGAIQEAANLLLSRIGAMKASYNDGMGTTDQGLPMLDQHSLAAVQALTSKDYLTNGYAAPAANVGGGGGSPPSSPPPPAPGGGVPPNPNAPFDPRGGQAFDPRQGGAVSDDRTGGFHTEFDAQKAGAIEAAIRNGAPQSQIDALTGGAVSADQVKAIRSYLKAHPSYTGFVNASMWTPNAATPVKDFVENTLNVASPGAGTGFVSPQSAAFFNGAGDAASFGLKNKVGAGVTALADRVTGDNRSLGDIYNSNLAGADIGSDALARAHPVANLAGETAGFIGGDALVGAGAKAALGFNRIARIPSAVRPVLGDALYGGLYGAGSSDNLSDVPGNFAEGAALSGLGGSIGRTGANTIGAALSPVGNAAVQRLTKAGITLTPGQILGANGGVVGRAAKGIEDRLAGFPIVGDVINNARRGGVEDFNRTAINDALAPVGGQASGVGHEAIADARQQVSDAYTDALGKMHATPDAQLTTDLQQIGQKVNTLSQSHREQFQNIVDTDLQPYLNGKTQLDGSDLQAIKQGLDARISNLRGQGATPQDRDLADRLADVRDSVLDLAGRTPGSDVSAFQRANQAYALLSRVEGAAAKSKDGVFSPNQYRQAVTKRGYGTTTANVASGSALGQQLATDASTILPSTVPDSGAAGRAALGLVAGKLAGATPGAALGGVTGYANDGLSGALTGSLIGAAAFSKPGLRGMQYLLAGSRGRVSNTLGDLLRRNSALGGAVGSPLLLQELPK